MNIEFNPSFVVSCSEELQTVMTAKTAIRMATARFAEKAREFGYDDAAIIAMLDVMMTEEEVSQDAVEEPHDPE